MPARKGLVFEEHADLALYNRFRRDINKAPSNGCLEIVPVPVPETRMLSGIWSDSSLSTYFSASFALLDRARAPAFGLGTGTSGIFVRWGLDPPGGNPDQ